MSKKELSNKITSIEEGQYIVIKDLSDKVINAYFRKTGKLYKYYNCITSSEIEENDEILETIEYKGVELDKVSCEIHDNNSFVQTIKNNIYKFAIQSFARLDYNLIDIVKKVNRDRWKFVSFGGSDIGVLLCATTTDEDFYYCYIAKDLYPHFSSCVGSYKTIDNDELSVDYSVLKHMVMNDRKLLVDKVEDFVKNSFDVVISHLSVE